MAESHRIAESSGSAREVAGGPRSRSAQRRGIHALDDLAGAQQHTARDPVRPAHDVDARMDAVAEVHVQVPRFAPHHLVARRAAHARVRSGVGPVSRTDAVVGLDLGDPHRDRRIARRPAGRHLEDGAEQARRDLEGQRVEVGAGRTDEAAGVEHGHTRGGAWHHEMSKPVSATTSLPSASETTWVCTFCGSGRRWASYGLSTAFGAMRNAA